MSPPEDKPPTVPPKTRPDADLDPEPFPLPFAAAEVFTPTPPPQDLSTLIAELTALVAKWHSIASDDRVPEDVRGIYHRCANTLADLVQRAPTYISELAPESAR